MEALSRGNLAVQDHGEWSAVCSRLLLGRSRLSGRYGIFLIIVKLPFAVPDPISEAEKETYDSLETYIQSIIVPDMQKKLRRDLGEPIRTELIPAWCLF